MSDRMRLVTLVASATLVVLVPAAIRSGNAQTTVSTGTHRAVGSWFGKAVQVCLPGAVPSACFNGQPAVVLFMTPTLTGEGLFVADDSLTLGGAPFGPHTTAHGQWFATSAAEFTADYTFMLRPFPPVADSITALRARWLGQVANADTLVGWVNAYLQPAVPLAWTRLLDSEFPAFPNEAAGIVTSPRGFVRDPALCRTPGCPLVFKFTVKRVAP
ncbi:MAG: hypothetical protein A3H97_04350 [Acidobacteria bacterium RIFCSPLOWO2_02_FULL_65_29]|nr:MAG: hypothetical protein A3H97_04350 [Acidobacteria bacterium RIFCSPLOWO2_02_FULL_65_29]